MHCRIQDALGIGEQPANGGTFLAKLIIYHIENLMKIYRRHLWHGGCTNNLNRSWNSNRASALMSKQGVAQTSRGLSAGCGGMMSRRKS
jgi:hypothetical protein